MTKGTGPSGADNLYIGVSPYTCVSPPTSTDDPGVLRSSNCRSRRESRALTLLIRACQSSDRFCCRNCPRTGSVHVGQPNRWPRLVRGGLGLVTRTQRGPVIEKPPFFVRADHHGNRPRGWTMVTL